MGSKSEKMASDSTVSIEEDVVVVERLRIADSAVRELVGDGADAEERLRNCLQVGARALLASESRIETELVESAFREMRRDFDDQLVETVDEIDETANDLLAEDGQFLGALAEWRERFDDRLVETVDEIDEAADELLAEDGELFSALSEWRQRLDESVAETFDEDSKSSAIAKIDDAMREVTTEHSEAIEQLIDPDRDGSPLRKWRQRIDDAIEKQYEEVLEEIQELREKIAVKEEHDSLVDRMPEGGLDFEDSLHEALCHIAEPYGDMPEQTGSHEGVAGNKKGDEVVTVNPDDTAGLETSFTLEMKDRKVSYPEIQEELDGAMENRGATAGIAVFARQDQAPVPKPFMYMDDQAMVVYDKDEPNLRLLQLAYLWARWVVRRAASPAQDDEVDRERILALIDGLATSMQHVATIKGEHTKARKKIDNADEHLSEMEVEFDEQLEALRDELA